METREKKVFTNAKNAPETFYAAAQNRAQSWNDRLYMEAFEREGNDGLFTVDARKLNDPEYRRAVSYFIDAKNVVKDTVIMSQTMILAAEKEDDLDIISSLLESVYNVASSMKGTLDVVSSKATTGDKWERRYRMKAFKCWLCDQYYTLRTYGITTDLL